LAVLPAVVSSAVVAVHPSDMLAAVLVAVTRDKSSYTELRSSSLAALKSSFSNRGSDGGGDDADPQKY